MVFKMGNIFFAIYGPIAPHLKWGAICVSVVGVVAMRRMVGVM